MKYDIWNRMDKSLYYGESLPELSWDGRYTYNRQIFWTSIGVCSLLLSISYLGFIDNLFGMREETSEKKQLSTTDMLWFLIAVFVDMFLFVFSVFFFFFYGVFIHTLKMNWIPSFFLSVSAVILLSPYGPIASYQLNPFTETRTAVYNLNVISHIFISCVIMVALFYVSNTIYTVPVSILVASVLITLVSVMDYKPRSIT